MRWTRAVIVGLVVAVIALVAVTVVQSALGLTSSRSLSSSTITGPALGSIGISDLALIASVAGFLIGFVYDFRRSRG